MRKSIKIFGLICTLSLLVSSILTIVDYWCFNDEFYKLEYTNLNIASSIGMSGEDLDKTTKVLLDYLKDEDLTLEVEANVNGTNRQVFNEREILHMEDVRQLYLNVMLLRNILLGVFTFTLFILVIKNQHKVLYISYKKSLFIIGGIFLAIGLFCAIDFNSFWTYFHHVFFTNDLWLLNPKTDILIMMVPSKFFFDLCVTIIFNIFVVMGLYFIVIKVLDKKVINK